MAILFYTLIVILTKFLFVTSFTLDIHYPENDLMDQYYGHFYPYTSMQSLHSNEYECACRQPCQCSYPYPPQRVYHPPPAYRSSPTPTHPPVIFSPSPPIIPPRPSSTPAPPTSNIQTTRDETKYKSEDFARSHTQTNTQTQKLPEQPITNVQTTQDDTKYKAVDYAHSHSQTQQSPGPHIRRSLHPYYGIVQSPINFQRPQQQNIYRFIRSVLPSISPAHQVYNFHNTPRTNISHGAGSISSRGSDFRSAMESSEIQNGNDVATHSPITISEYLSNTSNNFNNNRNKRDTALSPLAWARGINKNNYTIYDKQQSPTTIHETPTKITSNSNQREIADPSRGFLLDAPDSFETAKNNQSFDFSSNRGATVPFMDTRVLLSYARSSQYGGGVYYPTGYPVYQTYVRSQRPLAHLSPTTSAVSAVYPGQSSATFTQGSILNSVGGVVGSVYHPYRFSPNVQAVY